MKIFGKNIFFNNKAEFVDSGGFTLVELLLVVAIIGILAGVLTVSLAGQRLRALSVSAMETSNGALVYAVDCYLRGDGMENAVAGDLICNGSSTGWPALPAGCLYDDTDVANNRWRVKCTKAGQDTYVACFVKDAVQGDGRCCFVDGASYDCE